jgi:hypothetical protein
MKKSKLLLLGCLILSASLDAQTYVTKHTANAAINPLDLEYSSFWNTPVELHKYGGNGFSITHYNENVSGNIVASRSFGQSNPMLILNPLLNVPTGGNYLVISMNSSTIPARIVLSHVNFGLNSIIFSTQFSSTQSIPGQNVTGLTPIDAVYDGSQYVYMLMSGTSSNPSGRKLFLIAKIDLNNPAQPIGPGQLQSWGTLGSGSSVPLHFYPNDIEYVNSTHILVTGTCVDVNTSAVHFFAYIVQSVISTYNPFYITQSNSNYVPQRMFVESDGTNAYFIGENKLSNGTYGPTLFASYDIASSNFGINNFTNYIDVIDWTNMTSSDYYNNQIVVGGKLSTSPTNRCANMLFNTNTGALTDLEYYAMSSNPARSIFSTSTGQIFSSTKVSSTDWDVFRMGINNLTAPCRSYNMGASFPLGTVNVILNDRIGLAFSPTFTSYTLTPLSPAFTSINHCSVPDPEGRNGFSSSNVNADSFALYPNPALDNFNFDVYADAAGMRELTLHDLSGRLVLNRSVSVAPGKNTLAFSTAGLQPGIYLLRFEGRDEILKLVVRE